MVDTLEQLKELVKWAEEAGLKQLEVGGTSFTFSDYQLAKRVLEEVVPNQTEAKTGAATTPAEDEKETSIYDDPDLFRSTI